MNVKLKNFVSLKKGRNPTAFLDSGTYPYLTMDYLRGRDKDVKYVDYDENLVLVRENEILILWDGANAGEIIQSKVGFLSSTMAKISSKNENLANHFLFYLLKNFEKVLKDFAGGTTIPHLDPHVLLHSSFFIPSLKKQTAIAKFLDDKTAKIDRAIAQKEQLIDLLKERKQIIIQNAVTKGLNYDSCDESDSPDSQTQNQSPSSNHKKSQCRRMKDSGVEWLGVIPEGWELKKMKYVLNTPLKYGANESGIEYSPDLPRYVRITDFSLAGKLSEDKKLSLSWEVGKNYLLEDGDILFARSGATVGKSHQFKKSMSVENHYSFAGYLIKASPNEEVILSNFLNYFTMSDSFENWKSLIFNKATIENIGADKYSELLVVTPPFVE